MIELQIGDRLVFATGGGRAAAAGINDIDPSGIDAVFAKMIETYS